MFKKIIYFTISQFTFYKLHLGFFSKFLDSSLNFFLLKASNFFFFNLHFTILYFKLVLNIIKQLISKKSNLLISVPFQYNYLFKFLNTIKSLSYISNHWIPGLLTNFRNIRHFTFISFIKRFLNLKNSFSSIFFQGKRKFFLTKVLYQYFFFLKKGYLFNFMNFLPSFICFFNLEKNFFGLDEAFFLNLPFLTFLDLNLNTWSTKYLIPGNSKTIISLNFYYFLIIKNIFLGMISEKLNFLFLIKRFFFSKIKFLKNYNNLITWFFSILFLKKKSNFFILFLFNFYLNFNPIINSYFKKFLYLTSYKLKKKLNSFNFNKLKFNNFFFYLLFKPILLHVFFFKNNNEYKQNLFIFHNFFLNNYLVFCKSLNRKTILPSLKKNYN